MTPGVAILHYSAPPITGGVEAVILAHARLLAAHGIPVRILAGRGEAHPFPPGVEFISIPEMDSQHPQALRLGEALSAGQVPEGFATRVAELVEVIRPQLAGYLLIAHNVFTKHFNLALTAALHRLLDVGELPGAIAWCHDLSWTSANSLPHLHPGEPWDLLRTYRPDLQYVTVSESRRAELAGLLGISAAEIRVVYNGIDPQALWGLDDEAWQLVQRLEWVDSDINLLMPVRVTRAKNIEYALRVVAGLKASGVRPRLTLTGPPDPHSEDSQAYYQSLLDLRHALGIEREARFVYECGPTPGEPYPIGEAVVAGLLRACDLVFMPSFREGFGMPVLEGGFLGKPVFCTAFPAAQEIGGSEVHLLDMEAGPEVAAQLIATWAKEDRRHALAKRVRRGLTWEAIFQREIHPLLRRGRE